MVLWTEKPQKFAGAVVHEFTGEMGKAGIAPHIRSPDGELVIHRSAGIEVAPRTALECEPKKCTDGSDKAIE